MLIDGRDHDKFGDLIPNNGTYAVVTTHEYSQSGSVDLAGTTAEGLDLGPVHVGWEPIVLENYVWEEGYPQTPEEVLGGEEYGFPPDFFRTVAMSGRNGSQYVTDPDNLTLPLRGVTYVELPSGEQWNSARLGDFSEGLLIVHNSAKNARMSNVTTELFKGLIIADDMYHIHGEFLGAIFVLAENPLAGNCIGNGTADLLYSKEVLEDVIAGIELNKVNITVLNYWE
jgi:hypothetical protein